MCLCVHHFTRALTNLLRKSVLQVRWTPPRLTSRREHHTWNSSSGAVGALGKSWDSWDGCEDTSRQHLKDYENSIQHRRNGGTALYNKTPSFIITEGKKAFL